MAIENKSLFILSDFVLFKSGWKVQNRMKIKLPERRVMEIGLPHCDETAD